MINLPTQAGVHRKDTFSLQEMLNSIKNKPNYHKVGAVTIFIGVTRGETLSGETVKKMQLEAYEEKADEVLNNICEELMKRKGIMDVQVHHLTGEFEIGEDMVYVLVAGSHRNDVFPVLEEAIERYKKEAPIFKKEYVTGKESKVESYWVGKR